VAVAGQWVPPPAALRAASVGPGAEALTPEQLDTAVAGALARLGAALQPVRFEVRDLGGDGLALAFPTERVVWLDDDGAGHGWFIDPTPLTDEEFGGGAAGPLRAAPSGPAEGRMDLLSAVLHGLGHLAGLADVGATAHAADLMGDALAQGTRRTAALDRVFAQSPF
jgi:hypothetical protein